MQHPLQLSKDGQDEPLLAPGTEQGRGGSEWTGGLNAGRTESVAGENARGNKKNTDGKGPSPHVLNPRFWDRLKMFVSLGFEGPCSPLTLQAVFVALLLVAVSYLEFRVAISALALGITPLLKCDVGTYWGALLIIGCQLVLSVFLKTVAGYVGTRLRLKWRTKITRSLQEQLFSTPNLANYLVNLNHSVDNLDQRITDDVETSTILFWRLFFGELEHKGLISSFSAVFISVSALFKLGALPFFFVLLYNGAYLLILFIVMKPIVKLTYTQQLLEGAFRYVHLRIREFSESIVFYHGVAFERKSSEEAFENVYENNRKLLNQSALVTTSGIYGTILQGLVGFIVLGRMVSTENVTKVVNGTSTQHEARTILGKEVDFGSISTNYMILISSMEPLVELLSLCAQLAPIAGTMHRVCSFMEMINDGKEKLCHAKDHEHSAAEDNSKIVVDAVSCRLPNNGRYLFQNLSFCVEKNKPLIIVGPSGAGKTSLLRILGGLWPVEKGSLKAPKTTGAGGVLFLPQRPYLSLTTLREQLVYPKSLENYAYESDELLMELVRKVGLGYILKDYDLDTCGDWCDIFSGGEQQRIAFVRVLYHRPAFCIMDEATSALDEKLEDICMRLCAQYGVTCVSVGHRSTLLKYHQTILRLDGKCGFSIEEVPDWKAPPPVSAQLPPDSHGGRVRHDADQSSLRSEAVAPLDSAVSDGFPGHQSPRRMCCQKRRSSVVAFRLWYMVRAGFPGVCTKQSMAAFLAVSLQLLYFVLNINFITGKLRPGLLEQYSTGSGVSGDLFQYGVVIGVMGATYSFSLWLSKRIGLLWRKKLVNRFQQMYLNNENVYTINHLTSEVDNVDQRIAMDVKQFTEEMINHLFGYGGMLGAVAVLLLTIFSGVVTVKVLIITFVYASAILVLIWILMKRVTSLKYKLNMHEGNLRRTVSRSSEFAESIAFYQGERAEYALADLSYKKLVTAYEEFIKAQYILFSVTELVAASSMCASSAFYIIFMFSCGTAGSTAPSISNILAVMGVLQLTIENLVSLPNSFSKFASTLGNLNRIGVLDEALTSLKEKEDRKDTDMGPDGQFCDGKILYDNSIVAVANVVCCVPGGDSARRPQPILKNLSFEVNHGDNLIVMGPSGVGKTTLVRVLGELWPFKSGTIHRPRKIGKDGLFFLPQRPYLSLGSLRSQLIYPHEEKQQQLPDSYLVNMLKMMRLEHLLEATEEDEHVPGGLDRVSQWSDILSGGEQQRVGFIRAFYHQPHFCIMDEATSALDEEMESVCMAECKRKNITCVSVGHRVSLVKYHDKILHLKRQDDCDDGELNFCLEDVTKTASD